jgi:hypothetical protein
MPANYIDLSAGNVARDFSAITPSNTDDLTGTCIGLYVTGTGNIVYLNADGVERTVTVPNNFKLDCIVKRVKATGTTATGIYGYFI